MLAYLFPGQGSQARGMGTQLFAEFPEEVKLADELLGYSIQTLCLDDPNKQLNQTQFTQPAIFIVSALSYFLKLRENKKPDYVAGHSLGEYNALLAAGVFDFATGLQLVKKRGELMGQAQGGGMAAIVGMKIDAVHAILEKNNLYNLAIANHNSYLQVVISGPKEAIQSAQPFFETEKGISFIPLKVSGAFHSPLMQAAQEKFFDYLKNFTFHIPRIPVISNINAKTYHPAIITFNLANQMTHPVQWTRSIEFLLAQNSITLEELGPGKVLTGLLRRIQIGQ